VTVTDRLRQLGTFDPHMTEVEANDQASAMAELWEPMLVVIDAAEHDKLWLTTAVRRSLTALGRAVEEHTR